jgi:hypothetical protein
MANSTYEVLSIKFTFLPDWTECEVVCGPPSDEMMGVQGMHKKVFPKEMSAKDILMGPISKGDYLLW